MTKRAFIQVSPILATRFTPDCTNGLITLKVEVPWYLWQEILTHKRLARNASSRRAMSAQRISDDFGFYVPEVFYAQGKGMGSGEAIVDGREEEISKAFESVFKHCGNVAADLAEIGVAKTQANRVFPFFTMIHGILTGTEDAWAKIKELRLNKNADPDMQILFGKISSMINKIGWTYSDFHVPYLDRSIEDKTEEEVESAESMGDLFKCAARIARVSYSAVDTGRRKSDEVLGRELLANKHFSPFEHIAWKRKSPPTSCLNSKPADMTTFESWDAEYGWLNMRAAMETWPENFESEI